MVEFAFISLQLKKSTGTIRRWVVMKQWGTLSESLRRTMWKQDRTASDEFYKKVVYREYTDAKFNRLLTRSADEQYLGILGPVLYGEVGDTIKIFFKNNASRPFSMHPHGVLYQKNSEGSGYNDGTDGDDKADDAVQPGGHSGMRGTHCCSICSSICRGSRRPRSSAADKDRIGANSSLGGRYAGAVNPFTRLDRMEQHFLRPSKLYGV